MRSTCSSGGLHRESHVIGRYDMIPVCSHDVPFKFTESGSSHSLQIFGYLEPPVMCWDLQQKLGEGWVALQGSNPLLNGVCTDLQPLHRKTATIWPENLHRHFLALLSESWKTMRIGARSGMFPQRFMIFLGISLPQTKMWLFHQQWVQNYRILWSFPSVDSM